jgi:hypothetical protein
LLNNDANFGFGTLAAFRLGAPLGLVPKQIEPGRHDNA